MLKREYEGQNCSIACALEIVGERWTLLIVRDAFLGLRRFEQFQESLGIARNVLTDRLHWLVSQDILESVPYGSRPDRYEYRLTAKGADLFLTLTALRQWGDKYLTDKPSALLRRKSDQGPVEAALVTNGGEAVSTGEVELVAGPGRDPTCATWRLADRADPYSAEPHRSGPEPDGVPGQHSSSGPRVRLDAEAELQPREGGAEPDRAEFAGRLAAGPRPDQGVETRRSARRSAHDGTVRNTRRSTHSMPLNRRTPAADHARHSRRSGAEAEHLLRYFVWSRR